MITISIQNAISNAVQFFIFSREERTDGEQ